MYGDSQVLRQLSSGECLRLMASVPIGRIIYTRQALPAVQVVNFVLDGGDIVFRADGGGQLAAAVDEAVVAFEADHVDAVRRSGWSVTVIGRSREVTDPRERTRLARLGLNSWAPGGTAHFIRISPGILHGQRLDARRLRPPA